ncbi:MAG TPA: PAS domain-containing sensor histidine kinase [Gammaproteobacteria bacterium]|nr:PAS domain-containing sensor histidine kinase [Gammaproteobacteria bacterium]
MSQPAARQQQLQDAFARFAEVSEQLTGSYRLLQDQVTGLNRELAAARSERTQLRNEIRTLQQEASRSQRLSSMGEMTARLAHQVRTPLSTALLYASQLSQPGLPRAQHDCFVERLLTGLRHLDHMVNDMLVFARGGQGSEEIVALGELLAQVRQTLLPQLKERDAHWTVQLDQQDVQLCCQREILASVLANLATNALDACDGRPQLAWDAGVEGTTVCITLQDNGPGISPDLHEHIFEPFFTTRSSGTGLGLAVARAVINAHQGDIEIDSACQEGARFVIRLPLHDGQQPLPGEQRANQKKADSASLRYV